MSLPAGILGVDMDGHGNYWIYQALIVPVAGTWKDYDWESDTGRKNYLVHVSGESATVYTDDQGVSASSGDLRAAPDGSVWLAPSGCGGLANFDGTTWTRNLPGRCVLAFDIAPDGTMWLQATPQGVTFSEEPNEADTTETFVIPGSL